VPRFSGEVDRRARPPDPALPGGESVTIHEPPWTSALRQLGCICRSRRICRRFCRGKTTASRSVAHSQLREQRRFFDAIPQKLGARVQPNHDTMCEVCRCFGAWHCITAVSFLHRIHNASQPSLLSKRRPSRAGASNRRVRAEGQMDAAGWEEKSFRPRKSVWARPPAGARSAAQLPSLVPHKILPSENPRERASTHWSSAGLAARITLDGHGTRGDRPSAGADRLVCLLRQSRRCAVSSPPKSTSEAIMQPQPTWRQGNGTASLPPNPLDRGLGRSAR